MDTRSNQRRATEWQSNISGTEILHETRDMIGTTFREIVEENGHSVEISGVVTNYRKTKYWLCI